MFGRRKEPVVEYGIPEHIIRRVSMLPTPDLVMWSDQAINTVGRYLTLYQRDPSPDVIAEARTGAQVLAAIVEEMDRRNAGLLRS